MCYVGEMYAADVAGLGDLLPLLKQFDHLLVAVRGTVQALEEATGRPCHYLPPSTDTAKFCPYPDPPQRVIDFYAMGRRAPATHDALLGMAAKDDWYYMYDTTPNSVVTSHVEHRQRLADMMKRSRFFLVNCARFTDQQRTRGQQELGFRYFEGAAAGTVLVGEAPDNDTFREQFGWEDSVIALPADAGRIAESLAALDADPARLERISKVNVVNSLRRHDHVYRWAQVLSLAGLEASAAMTSRIADLRALADTIEGTVAAELSPSEAVGR
jgi:hypothetical protein